MKINDHFHCVCSFDADYPLKDMLKGGRNLRYLCLTDHCDLVDEYGKPDDSWSWEKEDEQLREAARLYPELEVRRGVELGQAILRPEAARQVLSEKNIDFVLGSMHNRPGGQDYYWLHYTGRQECLELLEEYLRSLLELSQTDFFDSLAHLTYPIRYMRYRDGVNVDFHPFDDLIYEILRTLRDRGKALELNTSGYRQGLGEPLPYRYILEMYRSLGGELITVGTDAHVPEDMTAGLEQGGRLLGECGFRYVTIYRRRTPYQLKLEDVL